MNRGKIVLYAQVCGGCVAEGGVGVKLKTLLLMLP